MSSATTTTLPLEVVPTAEAVEAPVVVVHSEAKPELEAVTEVQPKAAAPTSIELGQGQVEEVKESKSAAAATACTTTTTTNNNATAGVAAIDADSGTTAAATTTPPPPAAASVSVNQIKCSLTLDKLPKRVRLALARNTKKKSATTTSGSNGQPNSNDDPPEGGAIMCLFCDRSCADRDQYQLHTDQEHLTANLGRRASGRASSINSFPGCSMCNVADTKLSFASHSNDLDALFAHLVEKHADRYFACRRCNTRYVDAAELTLHNATMHVRVAGRDRRKSTTSVELNKDSSSSSPVDGDKIERKVTRQSNNQNGNGGGGGGGRTDDPHQPSLTRMAQAQNRFPLRGPARAMKGRLAANSQKASETRNGSGGGGRSAKLTRSTSVSSTGSNTFSSLVTNNSSSSSNTPPPSSSSTAGQSGGTNGGGGSTGKSSSLPLNNVFDENFYETITVTVRRNLSKWMDGKIGDRESVDQTDADTAEEAQRQSPELLLDHPPPAVRSTLFRTPPVDATVDSEIHEATALAAATAFPTLLTAEQYGVEGQAGGKIKRMFTKNSWKWKWDFVKKYKYVNEGGKIVKKAKEQNLGQRDLSKLDMWTQLTMRTKHEATKKPTTEDAESELDTSTGSSSSAPIGELVREEKRRQVNQLDTILDTRLLPQIVTEQNEQRLIKLETVAMDEEQQQQEADVGLGGDVTTPTPVDGTSQPKKEEESEGAPSGDYFPLGLQLKRNPNPVHHATGLTLSGEWARPRCYVCFGCGAKFETVKFLQDHKLTDHPNTQTTHYEMVGRELIEGDLYRHLYIPKNAIGTGNQHQKTDENEKPQRARRANPVIAKIPDDAMVPCSKCKKDCAGRFELYRHMLDCVGDYAWLMAKKRFKYRYYGNRSRRRKSNARSIFGCVRAPKKTVKKERLERIKRRKMRSRRKPQKPSDAETIEKMLANLPEKRISRTVATPPTSATKAPSNGVSTTQTPAKATPATSSASTGKKVQSSNKSNVPSGTVSPATTTTVAGTKRNLRSTLEAESTKAPSGAKTVVADKSISKKGKLATSTKEVKVSAKVDAVEESKSTERIAKEEINAAVVEKSGSKTGTTEIKQQQVQEKESTNGKDGEKEKTIAASESEKPPPQKRKTFMTRLASNTKGIIKKIGRTMKGNKQKKKNGGGGTTEAGDPKGKNSPPAPFLDEAAPSPSAAAETESSSTSKEEIECIAVQPVKAVHVDAQAEQEGKREPVESASAAVESEKAETVRSAEKVPVAINIQMATQETIAPVNVETAQPVQQQERKTEDLNLSALPLPEVISPQISPSLSVLSNPSNLSSPMTSPTAQKRRVRKLNDCIARLTDKLQEKLSKPSVAAETESRTVEAVIPENVEDVPVQPPPPTLPPIPSILMRQTLEIPVPLDVPLNLSLKKDDSCPSTSNLLQVATAVPHISVPTLDDCGVVDLSIRDKRNRVILPPAQELTIPRLAMKPPIIPEIVRSFITDPPLSSPTPPLPQPGMLRRPEEMLKMPMTLPGVVDPSLLNANGELIVPHVPKLGNYEVIKIPTYLPQKPTKGSKKQQQLLLQQQLLANKVAVPPPLPPVPVSVAPKKSSTTSAIEKITEMVADIVRNKKREAALKELAKSGLTSTVLPPDTPLILAPAVSVQKPPEPIVVPIPIEPPKKATSSRKRPTKAKANVEKVIPAVMVESLPKPVEKIESLVESSKDVVTPIVVPDVSTKTPELMTVNMLEQAPIPPEITIVPVIQEKRIEEVEFVPEPIPVVVPEVKPVEVKQTKGKAAPKGKKKVVIVEPAEIISYVEKQQKAVEETEVKLKPKPARTKRNVPEKKSKAKQIPSVEKEAPETTEPIVKERQEHEGQNGKVQRGNQDKKGKNAKKVKIVESKDNDDAVEKSVPVEIPSEMTATVIEKKPVELEEISSKSPVTTKIRKKRQSELAQILAAQPVINTTERDFSLTRRKSISIPEIAAKRVDSPKLKPSPPKKKKETVDDPSPVADLPKVDAKPAIEDKPLKTEKVKATSENIQVTEETALPKKEKDVGPKGKSGAARKSKQRDNKIAEEPEKVPTPSAPETTQPNQEEPQSEPFNTEEEKMVDEPKNPTPKPKKKRRSELTQIIADQLLESFKEVDEAQKDNLKILHDLSYADETMEIASRLKHSPIPRRQVTKKKPSQQVAINENPRKSPAVLTKQQPKAPVEDPPTKSATTPVETKTEEERIITAKHETVEVTEKNSVTKDERPTELTVANVTNLRPLVALPIVEKDVLISPSSTSSLFNTPVTTPLTLTPKPTLMVATKQPAAEDVSNFWKQANVDKEVSNVERRLDWVSKASEMGNNGKSGNLSDDSVTTNKGTKSLSASTFILKPSRLQAIASPPLESFDQLRNCDRSSTTSSSFCSPVVSPIGEPKKSLLNSSLPFPTPVRSAVSSLPTSANQMPAVNLLQFRDGPRDVDESDGDLEDNVSVHSSDSMESSMTSMTKSKVARKRRKRSLLTKKKVRGQSAVKANKENGPSVEKFHCDICNKTFEKADRLAKHKITLTHISRLSELEFLNSQNGKVEESRPIPAQVPEVKLSLPESIPVVPPRTPEPQMIVAVGTGAAVTPTPLLVPNHHRSPLMPGLHNHQSTLHNVHLEPISSPEQQQSYLMSSGLPQTAAGMRAEGSFGAALSQVPKRPTLSVSGLSQEEKLFYECCNMLKGSDRVGTQSENNSLTPRSNEAVSTWYSKTSTAFAIRSPTSSNYRHQKSPKYAFSKLDLNQFSDISSDSDNTFPSRSRPLINGGAPPVVAPNFHSTVGVNREIPPIVAVSNCNPMGNMPAGGSVVSPLRQDECAAAAVYSDSDMGDSFPSAPGASDNESYVRTILDRSSNNSCPDRTEWPKSVVEGAGFRREENSLTDPSAGVKFKTKAAMKGFDNFRVSIPTDGLDMNQALGSSGVAMGHNPHLDSKLASLADIALRSSTLPLVETAISVLHQDSENDKEINTSLEDSFASRDPDEENSENDEPDSATPETSSKTPTKRSVKNGRRVQLTRTDKNSVGNRLGFKAKKRKGADGNPNAEKGPTKPTADGSSKSVLDVYDFEDSQGSTEAPILPMKKCGKTTGGATEKKSDVSNSTIETSPKESPKVQRRVGNKKPKSPDTVEPKTTINPVVLDQLSQNSSDSFSDRDDFNYNSPVVEDSDLSSQGSPIKLPSADKAKSVQVTKKPAKKPLDNVQKKCLIMGRIFKNAQKNHKPEPPAKEVPVSPSELNPSEESGKKTGPPKVELDKLFDSLKEGSPKASKRVAATDRKSSLTSNTESPKDSSSVVKKTPKRAPILKKPAKKVELEDDEDLETRRLIENLVNDDLAVGQRKSKRKCIQQMNFVETWSSDEYEEFHSTKDIIAMIEANEKRSGVGAGRKKKLPLVTVEEPIKIPEKKATAGKIQNRRKTIGFKELDDDRARAIRKEIGSRYSPIELPSKPATNTKKDTATAKECSTGENAKQVGRQKRVSSEKLYYWSSSSSAEEDGGKPESKAAKGANGRVKTASGTTGTVDKDEDNDSAMEQHGWIVGGSHKKLVTLLAHAKGKKSDVLPKK